MIWTGAGNRPRLLADAHDNLWLACAANIDPEKFQSDLYFLRGRLVIYRATAASNWTDWQIVGKDDGPYMNEMHVDPTRLKKEGVLSVVVQDSPSAERAPSPIKVLDFRAE